MKLVIVESPSKAKKIREMLGKDYKVAASMGHVRDLPVKGALAVAFKDGHVTPTYEPLEKSQRAVAELNSLAKDAELILLASDPDREGEAIAWHVSELLGKRAYKRVVFHAITKDAVQKAVGAPRDVDMRLVNAQQARRVLDRVVGWVVSPTLRQVGKDAKSAGRVQSAALRVVAEREKEIAKFGVVDYFIISAMLEKPGAPPPFSARLVEWQGLPLAQRLKAPGIAEKIVDWAQKQAWKVQSCDRRDSLRNAPPPFTTATVQQAASVRLKLNPDATMKLLQELFEDGKITYHRTDSTALAPEALVDARKVIAKDFPPEYLPKAPITHATKSANAQEAHEAIRPTHPETGPNAQGDADKGKLYKLIWQRFIACQMAPGKDQITVIDVACSPDGHTMPDGKKVPMGVFQAKGKVLLFDGWRKLAGEDATDESKQKKDAKDASEDEDESAAELPLLAEGESLAAKSVNAQKRSTKPPPRYTQASLIKKLEHDGIGRPSTYAAILRTILLRGYVEEKKRKLHATPLGLKVTDFLIRHYSGNFIDLVYTAKLEDDLDKIARGEADWEAVVTEASFAILALAKRAGLWGNPLAETPKPPPPKPAPPPVAPPA